MRAPRWVTATLTITLVVGAALSAAPTAQAETIAVPAICADSVSSLTVKVGDVVQIPVQGAGCTLVNNSATGNLDRVSANGFVAFAEGTGAVFALVDSAGTQYLNKVNVTIIPAPQPTPSATSSTTGSATASPAASPSTATSSPPGATASPSQVPISVATASSPTKNQRLSAKAITFEAGADSGTVTVFDSNGNPLQLLRVTGATDNVRAASRGMNYTWQPANWQRLGYGDLCWSYAGYTDVSALILPVTTPPFRTVAAAWSFHSAIVSTRAGNVTYSTPRPGQVVDGGGEAITALTLCADGAPTGSTRSASKAPADSHGGGHDSGHDSGHGNQDGHGTGQCRGNGNIKHGCELHPEDTHWPYLNVGTTSGPSQQPSAKPTPTPTPTASAEPEERVTICEATTNSATPYRKVTLPVSQIEYEDESLVHLYPTPGWTSIIPPIGFTAGQNWPVGQATLADDCRVPRLVVEPTLAPSATTSPLVPSGSASPSASVNASPTITITPVPQPSFTAFGPINPWPPQYPIPVPAVLVPDLPTPTATPLATPASSTSTPSPFATPPSPSAPASIPQATPSFPVPPTPPPLPTPTAKPSPSYAWPSRLPDEGPYIVPPLQPPGLALTPVLAVNTGAQQPTASPSPSTSTASPLASPPIVEPSASASISASASGSASATSPASGAASASPTNGSPSASPSASTPPASTPPASTPPTTGTGTVTLTLTNGPTTVDVTVPIATLVKVTTNPSVDRGTGELANTGDEGSSPAGPIAVGLLLMTLVAVPWAGRSWRRRVPAVAVLLTASLTLGAQAAWSAVSQDSEFRAAQANPIGSVARMTFHSAHEGIDGVGVAVFRGTDASELRKGPGWYVQTARPGRAGNVAIAGHRTGYGAPFAHLDQLAPGDTIDLRTTQGARIRYEVVGSEVVAPGDTWVLGDDPLGVGVDTLTLTTCDPPHVNSGRLVVFAVRTNAR